ncbi:MAG: hypothetical protein ACREMA_02505 [Longimicrobiales bacterium]
MVDKNIAQVRHLEQQIRSEPLLELLATGPLSVLNFRYRGKRLGQRVLNELNARLVAEIQMRGLAIPSSYSVNGKTSIRVCNLNHRSRQSDFDALTAAAVSIGNELARDLPARRRPMVRAR